MNHFSDEQANGMQSGRSPLVSIVTVAYNVAKGLERTILSVDAQSYENVEFIIIDGGSTDGTLDVIRKHKAKIDCWVSEPDDGIYDAMNKGVRLAKGKWLNFMNAGDVFVSDHVLAQIRFEEYEGDVLIYGDSKRRDGINLAPSRLSLLRDGIIFACHQAMFFNRELLSDQLYYDSSKKIYADYELVDRLFLFYPNKFRYVEVTVVESEGGGVSSYPSLRKRCDKFLILKSHYGLRHALRVFTRRVIEIWFSKFFQKLK